MAQDSGIQWTDATWNPVAGCSIVSPGCHNCYAAVMAARLEVMGQAKYAGTTKKENGHTLWTGKINTDDAALLAPLKWKKPKRIFVNSMSDLFHEDVPDEFIVKCFAVMLLSQRHTYQVLTKRPERMRRIVRAPNFGETVYDMAFSLSHKWTCGWLIDHVPQVDVLPNVWLGVSVEDQQRADERIPLLLQTPAAVRFLSCEPLLGPIDFDAIYTKTGFHLNPLRGAGPALSWVIVGGESGPGARSLNLAWARSLRDQCAAAQVPLFMKQLGEKPYTTTDSVLCTKAGEIYTLKSSDGGGKYMKLNDKKGGDMEEWPEDLRVRQFPEVSHEA